MKKFFALSLLALVLGACGSVSNDTVCVNSVPANADVYIDGELSGKTPLCADLDKNAPHEVVIKLDGYKDANYTLASTNNPPFVKVCPLDDAGFYKALDPNPVDARLLPSFLPESTKENNYEGFADAISKANKLFKEGKICEHEYSSMCKTITDFYAPNVQEEMAQEEKAKEEAAKAEAAAKEEAAKAEPAKVCEKKNFRCPECEKKAELEAQKAAELEAQKAAECAKKAECEKKAECKEQK
ncbi:MAG: PEGA domain-containing protein [Opitutales bacterium]|nr:PEGA domain-containing protein [Opitutales bacterium]